MKKYSYLLIFLLSLSTAIFGQQDDDNPTCICNENCEGFENDTIGNWQVINASISTNNTNTQPDTTYLQFGDESGASWGFNNTDYTGDYSIVETCLCWDFKVFDDSNPGVSVIHPKITIYSGTNPLNNDIRATFISTLEVTENSGWERVCASISLAETELPNNSNGSWQGPTVQDWNELITDVSGIGFNVDVANSSTQDEIIGVDNICLCLFDCNTLAPYYFTSDVNGQPKQEFCYGEDVYININTVDYPYNATYLDTWLDPNYETDHYNGAGWNWDVLSGIYNYSQILRDKGEQPFVPIDDYYIKLAVDHPSCGWIESYASFQYVCCDPEAPAFITTDANGHPKQEFCYGEDVYIKINTVDYPYCATYLDTWTDPNYLGDQYNGADWNWDVFSGIYNYSQILRDKGQIPFDPVDDYYIKLAVDHPGCGWIESYASFQYTCCDEDNLAQFNADIQPIEGTVSGGGQDLSGYGATHSFCIYTDTNNDGVFEILDCSSSPNFSFPIQEGTEYWILHRVFTLCGDYCYIINFTTSPGFGMTSSASSLSCDDFPLPCNLTTPLAKCPISIIGNTGIELRLNWNPVQSAASYEVSIVYDDEACGCSNSGEGSNISGQSSGTKFDIPISGRDMCFSYTVRARCQDGSFSNWSDPVCYPDCLYGFQSETEDASGRNDIEVLTFGKIDLFPNPFSNELNISLYGFESDQVTIQITNLQGQLIKIDYVNLKLHDNYLWRPNHEIKPGVYLVTFTSDNYRETKKVVYTK